jgi:D-glycero-D-manno-heptose 1,7-bisphosphate phosphatase
MNTVGIFLDRDGTINEEVDFLTSPKDLKIIPKSAEAIKEANKLGLRVIVATNQSGIARGLLSEKQLGDIHNELLRKLAEHGAYIDKFYYCPHHPEIGEGKYRKDCECRKPGIGMLQRAAKDFGLDLSKSFVIGDKKIDIETGNNAGSIPILVLTGYGKQELEICRTNKLKISYVAENIFDAVQYIKSLMLKKPVLTS